MKEFIGTFIICLICVGLFSLFFLGLIIENLGALIIFIAFFLAVLITVFINQESRIEGLEKKIEELVHDKED